MSLDVVNLEEVKSSDWMAFEVCKMTEVKNLCQHQQYALTKPHVC